MPEAPKIFGIGQCAFDYVGAVDGFPPADAKCDFTDLTEEGGGPVATALAALARWGARCSFAGVVGDDAFGGRIRDSLEREGVDLSGLLVRPGSASQFAFIAALRGDGRRTVFCRKATGAALKPDEIDMDAIRSSAVLHTDCIFAEASVEACKVAKAAGVLVSVDAGSPREGMLEAARHCDFFIASAAFGEWIAGEDDPEKACREIAALGPKVAGVTLGKEGYVALHGGRMLRGAAYSVKAVDTTACGDIFHAGFLHGMLSGFGVEAGLDFAAFAASRIALRRGGRAGIVSPGEWPGPREDFR